LAIPSHPFKFPKHGKEKRIFFCFTSDFQCFLILLKREERSGTYKHRFERPSGLRRCHGGAQRQLLVVPKAIGMVGEGSFECRVRRVEDEGTPL
jgi:hypothetical protein